jgi:phosphoserine phosphatase
MLCARATVLLRSALVERLKARGVLVYLVTGGIRPLIEPVADALGLPYDRIFSNVLAVGSRWHFATDITTSKRRPRRAARPRRWICGL